MTGCNCQGVTVAWPLNGQHLTDKLGYQAAVTSNGSTEHFTGLTENTFKYRHNGHMHMHNFRHLDIGHLEIEEQP